MKILVRFPGKPPMRSKRAYYFMLVGFWIYATLWICALLWMYYGWHASKYYKLIPYIVVVLFGPSGSDLIRPYSSYVQLFKERDQEEL